MAVRIPDVGTPINLGEVELKSEDWNDSLSFLAFGLNKVLTESGSSDNSTESKTASKNSTNGYSEIRSLTINPFEVVDDLLIVGDLASRVSSLSRGSASQINVTATAKLRILIDDTEEFEISHQSFGYTKSSGTIEDYRGPRTRGFLFKYKPTESQISSGFTISLQLECINSATETGGSGLSNASAENNYWVVFGTNKHINEEEESS